MESSLPAAPVSAHAEVDIAASARQVWTVLADIASWPTWNPAVRQAVFDGQLDVGARFRYSTPFGSMSCRLTRVDAPTAFAFSGRLLMMRQRHAWQIDPVPGGVHVVTDATMSGLSARLFHTRLRQRLQGELDALVQLLKLEAEARVTEAHEEAARHGSAGEGEGR